MDGRWPLALPVDLLDVLVHLGGQAMTTFLAAALEHFAPTLGGHASAESVNARPTANFRLIGSFWHDLLTSMHSASFLLEIAPLFKGPSDYTVGLPFGQIISYR